MQEIVRRESIPFNSLDDIVKAAKDTERQDSPVFGLKPLQHKSFGPGVTIFAGKDRMGVYFADQQLLKVWPEKGVGEK